MRDQIESTAQRGVLCLTFDNMGNAVEVGKGRKAGPDDQETDLIVGFPRVIGLLKKLDLRATFFIEGWNAVHHPDVVKSIAEAGHEIGLHGWVHETFHKLSAREAERNIVDSLTAFRALGLDPKGFRAPGGLRGPYAARLLRKYGLEFDCSIDETEHVAPRLLDGGVLNIPWRWPMIDFYQYFMHPEGPRTPVQLEALWSAELTRAAQQRSVLTLIFHPFVSGNDLDRFRVMERLLYQAVENPDLEVLNAGAVASWVSAQLRQKA